MEATKLIDDIVGTLDIPANMVSNINGVNTSITVDGKSLPTILGYVKYVDKGDWFTDNEVKMVISAYSSMVKVCGGKCDISFKTSRTGVSELKLTFNTTSMPSYIMCLDKTFRNWVMTKCTDTNTHEISPLDTFVKEFKMMR
jgi:hypothetical protein